MVINASTTPQDADPSIKGLLQQRSRRAALVLLAPMAAAMLVGLVLFQTYSTATRFANVFETLRSSMITMERELAGASRSTGADQMERIEAARLAFLEFLKTYTALRTVDSDGGNVLHREGGDGKIPEDLLAIAAFHSINFAESVNKLGIAEAEMPEALRHLWEEEQSHEGHADRWPDGNGAEIHVPLEELLAATLTAANDVFRSEGLTQVALDEAVNAISDDLGPANHLLMTEFSSILNQRMAWGARIPVYIIVLMFGLALIGIFLASCTTVRPLSREIAQIETDLIDAREKARAGEKTKAEFLASMSHEIRTPLNGVMGMAELVAGTRLDPRQRMFVETIQLSAHSLLEIINDILDLSKINAGQLEFHNEPFKLSRLAAEPVQMLSAKAVAKNLELAVRLSPQAERFAAGDFGRLRQIMVNLVGNAVKFTAAGQVSIDIDTRRTDGRLVLHVAVHDTGIGIPAEQLERVFEQFSQVDQSSTRAQEGTGLGLAITRGLIEGMGGSIWVVSEPGSGTTFRFNVPLEIYESNEPKPSVPRDIRGKRVLVIDDNEANRLVAQELLTSWEFDGASAMSGREGLQKLLAAAKLGRPFELVLLDHHMPGMDGEEVIRRIRDTPELCEIPVILLTSISEDTSAARCRDLGINGYLVKPTLSSPLFDSIMQAMNRQSVAVSADATERFEEEHVIGSAGCQILLAEDNRVNRLLVEHILKGMGVSYCAAVNGFEAVEKFRAVRPAIVLMDCSMPGLDGFSATEHIREYEAMSGLSRTVIIGVTAHALDGDRDRCLRAGMDDYLAKPIPIPELTRLVRKYLNAESPESGTNVTAVAC